MSKRCRWSPQDNRVFVETLLAQKAAGNQAQSGWKSTAWTAVAAALKKDATGGGAEKTSTKCSDHWFTLKAEYAQVKRLRCMSGFGWDDGRMVVIADDEHWEQLKQKDPQIGKWKTTSFPIYDEMHALVDGIMATGSGAFQAGALPAPNRSRADRTPDTSRESSVEQTEDVQSQESSAPPLTRSGQDTVQNKSEILSKKRSQTLSDGSLESNRPRKHRRQQQDQMNALLAKMSESVEKLCSPTKPTLNVTESPRRRRIAAIKLMGQDGDFKKSECVPVIRLFTSSIDIVDSFLAIEDQEVRTLFIRDYLTSPSSM